MLVRLWS